MNECLDKDMFDTFEFRAQGRRPATYFAFGVWLVLSYLAWHTGAPALAWGGLAFFFVILGWWLAANPSAGMRLTPEVWEIHFGPNRWSFPLRDIDSVIVSDSKGRNPQYRLQFTDGAVDPLPAKALPRGDRFSRELRRRGIRLVNAAPPEIG